VSASRTVTAMKDPSMPDTKGYEKHQNIQFDLYDPSNAVGQVRSLGWILAIRLR
jgi:hypothetical protein